MAALVIRLDGYEDDLVFLRDRVIGAIEDLAVEYEPNLDAEIDVSWEME